MNKGLLIGVSVLAVAGIGGFFWWKSRQKSSSSSDAETITKSAEAELSVASAPTESVAETPTLATSSGGGDVGSASSSAPTSKKEERQERRQIRKNCRAEAKSRRLKGKELRQFKRDCKAAGGYGLNFTDEADFAFNGFASFD